MSGSDDYVMCPAVARWLPARLGSQARLWTTLRRVPRSLRRLAVPAEPGTPAPALLVVARAPEPVDAVPADLLDALPAGALVADVCLPPRGGPLGWVSAELRARRIHAWTAGRLTQWLARGLFDVEQWLAIDPPDALVTVGRARGRELRRPRPPRPSAS